MFSHFTLGSNDLERSRRFYSVVMNTLGQTLIEAFSEQDLLMYAAPDQRFPSFVHHTSF